MIVNQLFESLKELSNVSGDKYKLEIYSDGSGFITNISKCLIIDFYDPDNCISKLMRLIRSAYDDRS